MSIGTRIREARKRKGLSQEELAKSIQSTKQAIYKYENDIVTNIPPEKIEKMAAALSISPSDLMGWPTIASIAHPAPDTAQIAPDAFAKWANGDITFSIVDTPSQTPTDVLWDKIFRLSAENRNKVDGYVSALLDEQYREEIAKSKNA